MIKLNLINRSLKSRRLWLTAFLAFLIVGVFFATFCSAQRSGRADNSGADQQQQKQEESIKAVLFYKNVEDPKQLFDILQNIYRVQFEGADTVVGPLTLISEDYVDVRQMLRLLDEALQDQDKKTFRRNQIIRIEPRSKTEHKFIPLENVEAFLIPPRMASWSPDRKMSSGSSKNTSKKLPSPPPQEPPTGLAPPTNRP